MSDEGDRWTVKLDSCDFDGHLVIPLGGAGLPRCLRARPSGHFSACLDICPPVGCLWTCSSGQDDVYSMRLAWSWLPSCPRVVFSSCVLLFFVWSGLGGSLWQVLALSWACLMCHRGVILPSVWSGTGSGCLGGVCQFNQLRLLGFTAFGRRYGVAVLGHGLVHALVASAVRIGFEWDCTMPKWRPNWSKLLLGVTLLGLSLSGVFRMVLILMCLLLGCLTLLGSGPMEVLFWIRSLASLPLVRVFFAHQSSDCWNGRRWGHVDRVRPEGEDQSCRGFCSVPGPLQSVQRAEMWGVILALQSADAVHLGVDNLGVVRHVGRLLDGRSGSTPLELVTDGDLLLLTGRMLYLRGLNTVRITKVKGHADEDMVLEGRVRDLDRLGNDAADEAADFGRRRVSNAVIDARRSLSGVWSLVPCSS